MLHYIRGHITETMPGMVVIENGGIGFEVSVPEGSSVFLATPEEEISLFVAMQVREDDISLFGFSDRESLELFKLLQTVSGVGAKAALSMLSAFPCASDLKRAIYFEDAGAITKANGIGKKTAQRVVLDLKDKVGVQTPEPGKKKTVPKKNSARDDALIALVALGYSRSEASGLLNNVTQEDLTTEEYIRLALRAGR